MIKDIKYDENKNDLVIVSSELPRAANLIDVQLGQLYYRPDWGVDLEYFLNPDYEIQAESFEAYLLQRIGFWGMNVINFAAKQGRFVREMIFNFGNAKENNSLMRG